MIADDDGDEALRPSSVIPFPFSRTQPTQTAEGEGAETYGNFAVLFGMPREQTTGHWCSRCQRIWFGYLLEVTCPTCGSRHG